MGAQYLDKFMKFNMDTSTQILNTIIATTCNKYNMEKTVSTLYVCGLNGLHRRRLQLDEQVHSVVTVFCIYKIFHLMQLVTYVSLYT